MKQLMRVWYDTDLKREDGEMYVGMFSAPFPLPVDRQIVGVDWSVPGQVQVTYVIQAVKDLV